MSFDLLAPHYRWMELLCAGEKLQRCRTAFLNAIPAPEHALVYGEGNGRFLAALCRRFPMTQVTVVEASAVMIALAQARLRRSGLENAVVTFVHADALEWQPPAAHFDLIVTCFFFDCFREDQLQCLIPRIAGAAQKKAHWLVADFKIADSGWRRLRSQLIVRFLYAFFRRVTRLPARSLVPLEPLLGAARFMLVQRLEQDHGLLFSDCWRRGENTSQAHRITCALDAKMRGSMRTRVCFYSGMDHKPHSQNRWLLALGVSALATVSLSNANAGTAVPAKNPAPVEADWKVNTIAPVTNPIFFEDPVIRSEVRPIFIYHTLDNNFITGGGHATLYALQIRYALTDRLALIATQDGHFDIDSPGLNVDGWMDLAAGFKYALIDDAAHQFILTPGLTFHIPTGDREIFQGRGGGEFNPFVSFSKGFGDLHFTGNVGLRIPVTNNEQNLMAHYSLMVDYYTCRWFIPFATVNFWTNLNDGNNIGLRSNGYDVVNFGANNVNGVTQGTVGFGFRSRVHENVDLGFAYEIAMIRPYGLTNNRVTVDMCIRF